LQIQRLAAKIRLFSREEYARLAGWHRHSEGVAWRGVGGKTFLLSDWDRAKKERKSRGLVEGVGE
jgi:hypothetical protein